MTENKTSGKLFTGHLVEIPVTFIVNIAIKNTIKSSIKKNNIDIIEKKDVTSEYVNDANDLIPIIEKLVDCIDSNGNVQLFVTRANVLAMNIDFLICLI